MPLPSDLTLRFQQVQDLTPSGVQSEILLVQDYQDYIGAQHVIKMVDGVHYGFEGILDRIRKIAEGTSCLAAPTEWGWAADGRFFQVMDYFPDGSMMSLMGERNDRPKPEDCRAFLRQMIEALKCLHEADGEVTLLHGDIKPSNILLRRAPEGGCQFALADFDSARQLGVDTIDARPLGYTIRYAAPEVLAGGEVTAAIDYWSLGMVILEWLIGEHPLTGLDDLEAKARLGTTWKPHFLCIEDALMRSLLGGLLERTPGMRWGVEQCERWLEGDSAIISEGLEKAGETTTDIPFHIVGIQVFSARGLAEALLRQWAVDVIEQEELSQWLQQSLRREDIDEYLSGITENNELNNELRLLHFCHEICTDLPAIWRGRELTAENVGAAGGEGSNGEVDSRQWLQSLLDDQCFKFYTHRNYESVEEIGHRLQEAWEQYGAAWEALIALGAPEAARPNEDEAIALVAHITFSEEARAGLRQRAQELFEPRDLLLRAPWFLHFGTDLDSIPDSQLLVLQHLDSYSLLNEVHFGSLDELGNVNPEGLRDAVIRLESQQRLMRHLVVRPSSTVTVLRPGEVFSERSPERLADAVRASYSAMARIARDVMGRVYSRLYRWVRRREPPSLDEGLWAEIRMVRLSIKPSQPEIRFADEIYLALVSWRVEDGLRTWLRLSHIGFLISQPRLITPVMPNQGHMLLVLTSDSSIQIMARQRWFHRRRRTIPIVVRFAGTDPLDGLVGKLRTCKQSLLQPVVLPFTKKRLLKAKGGLIQPANKRILPVIGKVHGINPRDYLISCTGETPVRRPMQHERSLFELITSSFQYSRREDVYDER